MQSSPHLARQQEHLTLWQRQAHANRPVPGRAVFFCIGLKRLDESTFVKKFLLFSSMVILGSALFWLVENSRASTPTPEYRIVRTDGKFEVRDYPEMSIATVAMKGGEMNSGFGDLFRFITGANEGREKIAMTTPVLIERAPENETMSFILPKELPAKGVPLPTGERVKLGKVGKARFAVLRFDGGRSDENEKKALEALRAWAKEAKIELHGEPLFAYYDPPWTPTAMRRNEVLVRAASEKK